MADQAIYAPMRVFDANGDPVPGARATFYASGTLTQIDIWSDAAGSILAMNPVVADGDGYMPQRFVDEPAKVVLTDAEGATLWTLDPVSTTPTDFGSAAVIGFSPTANIPASNLQSAVEMVDSNARARDQAILDEIGDLGDLSQKDLSEFTLATADWETGTSDDPGIPTPEQVAAAITAQTHWREISTHTPTGVGVLEFDLAGLSEAEIQFDEISCSSSAHLRVELHGVTDGWIAANLFAVAPDAAKLITGRTRILPPLARRMHFVEVTVVDGNAAATPPTVFLTSFAFDAAFIFSTPQAIDKARLSWASGNYDAGRVAFVGIGP